MGRLGLLLVTALLGLIYGVLTSEPALAPPAVRDALWLATVVAATVLVVQTASAWIVAWAEWRLDGQRPTHLLRFLVGLVLYGAAAVVISRLVVGVDLLSIAMASAATAVVVGLAVQATLGNVFAGVAMRLERPATMRLGDVVEIGGVRGALERITWRSVAIRTERGSTVVIPNDRLAGDAFEVFAGDAPLERRVHVKVPVALRPRVVTDLVTRTVRDMAGVDPRVPPTVLCGETEFAGGVAELQRYEITYAARDFEAGRYTDALLRERLWYALRRAGVGGEDGAAERERRARARRSLEAEPALRSASPQQRDALVRDAPVWLFAAGETVRLAPAQRTSLFVVVAGGVGARAGEAGAPGDEHARSPTALATDGRGGRQLALQRIAAELARHVGPIAQRLVAEAASRHADEFELFQALAGELDDAEQRAAFLAHAPAGPRTWLGAGDVFGASAWLTGEPMPPCGLEAVDELVLVEVPHARLGDLVEPDRALHAALCRDALVGLDAAPAVFTADGHRAALRRRADEALAAAE
jgi:small-conductance mechanosensitive channel